MNERGIGGGKPVCLERFDSINREMVITGFLIRRAEVLAPRTPRSKSFFKGLLTALPFLGLYPPYKTSSFDIRENSPHIKRFLGGILNSGILVKEIRLSHPKIRYHIDEDVLLRHAHRLGVPIMLTEDEERFAAFISTLDSKHMADVGTMILVYKDMKSYLKSSLTDMQLLLRLERDKKALMLDNDYGLLLNELIRLKVVETRPTRDFSMMQTLRWRPNRYI